MTFKNYFTCNCYCLTVLFINDMITRKYENAKIKIISFDFAKFLDNENFAKSLVGSPMYMESTILQSLISEKKW